MSIKEAYYYLYYKIYKTWSRDYNPLLSNNFRADISIMALKIWLAITIYSYISILRGSTIKLSITEPLGLIPVIISIGSTLYFFTFSKKWKPYFEKFEKWPRRKNIIGSIIVWSIVVLIFVNLIVSIELMKNLNT